MVWGLYVNGSDLCWTLTMSKSRLQGIKIIKRFTKIFAYWKKNRHIAMINASTDRSDSWKVALSYSVIKQQWSINAVTFRKVLTCLWKDSSSPFPLSRPLVFQPKALSQLAAIISMKTFLWSSQVTWYHSYLEYIRASCGSCDGHFWRSTWLHLELAETQEAG